MEAVGFTPTFFLELIIAVGSGLGSYWAMKTDLKNAIAGIAEEKRQREMLDEKTDRSIDGLRENLGTVGNRVSVLEGERRAA